MKVLIIGGGGREHALAWKAAASKQVEIVFVAPGNAGTAAESGVENIDISATDIQGLLNFANLHSIDLTIVGPEAPLVAGICDQFAQHGLRCFGPSQKAAMLEGSKSFAKDFMQRHGIPTAAYQSFCDIDKAVNYIRSLSLPVVIKADGLAAGKGVIIADNLNFAEVTERDMLSGNTFGEAGSRVVIEEFLVGEEVSYICLVDGKSVLPMASSQDHKAANDGDTGANTGGMGAYSPSPIVDDALEQRILDTVIKPVVEGMAKEGAAYTGFLYAGLMVGADGIPNVVEFNCRFGDPEAQPVLTRLRSDLVAHCYAAVEGSIDQQKTEWDPRSCLGVVMAAEGYPGSYSSGHVISGLEGTVDGTKVFHAGTRESTEGVVTAGGRVLCITALGNSVADAQKIAYERVDQIRWKGAWCRRDIGHRAVTRERS